MRLVRFEDESGGLAVDFHPLITVISGLPTHINERLTRAVAAIASGGDPGGRGTLEVHGIHLELTRETLELLELSQPIDVIVRAEDLPGHRVGRATRHESGPHRDGVGSEVESARAAIDRLQREYTDAVDAVESYRSKLAALSAEYDQLERDRAVAVTQLDHDAPRDLDAARAALRAAQDPSTSDESTTRGAAAEADAAAELAELEERLSESIERSNELKHQLRSLRALDPEPVRAAYDALAPLVGGPGVGGPGTDANRGTEANRDGGAEDRERTVAAIDAVLARWQQHIESAPPQAPDPGGDEGALQRLTEDRERALRLVEEIRAELDRPGLDPELVAELERTHDRIFEMDGKAPRFGAAKHHRALEELRAEEAALLQRLGFETWSAYVMGMSSVEARTEDDYAVASRNLMAIDREFNEATKAHEARRSAAAAAASHAAERAELVRSSVELIEAGEFSAAGDAEVVDALLARRAGLLAPRPAPVEPLTRVAAVPPEALGTAEENLRWALGHTGVELPGQDLNAAQLCALAGGWLDAMSGLPDRIEEVSTERTQLEEVIERLGARYEALLGEVERFGRGDDLESRATAAVGSDGPRRASASRPRSDAAAAALAAVAAAEQRCAAHDRACELLASVDARGARLELRSADLQFSLNEREHRVAQAVERLNAAEAQLRQLEASDTEMSRIANKLGDGSPSSDPSVVESIEWYILARLAQQRAVSFVGSLPIVFDNAFSAWDSEEVAEVYERLVRMGEVIQIIVLTDDPSVVDWARSIGDARAKVIDSLVVTR